MLVFFQVALLAYAPENRKDNLVKANMDLAAIQMQDMLDTIGDTSLNPGSVVNDQLDLVPSKSWISGFFPGSLWYMYEYTRDEKWKEAAIHFTRNVEAEKYNAGTHDMGFKMFCSFGNAYRLTGDPNLRKVLLQSAKTLITRFNPRVGCIRSWDHHQHLWEFPVIVDNMMNLELLFWAFRETRDSTYYKIAIQHAETTLRDHFREDGSSYHVVSYDTLTGAVMKKNTHQGYSHESAWARGQAWGLYGFTMTYRETGEKRFLFQAEKIADFILSHPNLPEDMVPYWDFNAPEIPDTERDASSAAIISSALYELSIHANEKSAQKYLKAADRILNSLSSPEYLAETGSNHHFLLKHSVGNYPGETQIDVPICYADYYFLEANMRKLKISGNWKSEAKVVLKLDDLLFVRGGPVSDRWEKFATLIKEKEVPASVGIICNSLEKGDETYIDWIKKRHHSGMFEFWNHGYAHSKRDDGEKTIFEFKNTSLDSQVETIMKSQQLARMKLGFEFETFGAPYNKTDKNTPVALSEFRELSCWLYPPDGVETSMITLHRIKQVNIEYPVHQPSFYHLWNNFYFFSDQDILTLQGHPNSWDDMGLSEFEKIVNYFIKLDIHVVKPASLI